MNTSCITASNGSHYLGQVESENAFICFKNLFLYSQAQIKQTKYVVMMTKKGSTKILFFMTPGAGDLLLGRDHISHIVKMYYFFRNLQTYTQAQIKQTKYVVMMTREGSTKIINFMTPRAGFLVLGFGHISCIVKLHYFYFIYFENTLIRFAQIRHLV